MKQQDQIAQHSYTLSDFLSSPVHLHHLPSTPTAAMPRDSISVYVCATRYHTKACNSHVGPLGKACECHFLPRQGVNITRVYEG